MEDVPPSSPPQPVFVSRKRARDIYHEDSNTSSDPLLFSSDPPEPSIDNYSQKSRKRQYQGPWWGQVKRQHRPQEEHATRTSFARNLDSGVWMGSDSTDETLPEAASVDNIASGDALPRDRVLTFRPPPNRTRSPAENEAYQVVQDSVDYDRESVDISGLELGQIPADLLSPLRLITKQANFLGYNHSPKDDDFEPLRPSLQLFLQKNILRKLPAELWNLEYLTVLSLRQNKLTYIPPSIARLRHLRELNLACNRLRYLPWELLRLITGDDTPVRNGPLRNFTVSPNPFFRAVSRNNANASGTGYGSIHVHKERNLACTQQFEEEMRTSKSPDSFRDASWRAKMHRYYYEARERADIAAADESFSWDSVLPLHMSSTPVVYLNIDGSPVDTTGPLPPSTIPHTNTSILPTAALDQTAEPTQLPRGSTVPSLFELSTSAASKVAALSELHNLLPPETPKPVLAALDLANAVKEEEGDRMCSVCERSYVIPRTEWIEFWHRIPVNPMNPELLTGIGMDELFLPFLRRGCSWRCVPS